MARPRADLGAATPRAVAARSVRDEFDRLGEDWDALADGLGASPLLRPGWFSAWWRAFGRGRLEVVTAGRPGALRAVLPVVHRHGAVASASNWHSSHYGRLRVDPAAGRPLLDELFARHSPQLSFGFLGSPQPDVEELSAAAEAARYTVLVRRLERSPVVEIGGDWSVYESSLSRNLRRDIRRCQRRLAELGQVSLDVCHDTTGLREAFAIERSGWKGAAGTAITSQPRTARFYTDVASWAAAAGTLRLIFLRVDGRAIAFHLALEDNGAYLPLKGGYDSALQALSPGKLIIHATLERAFAVGLRYYDFLGGFDDYKRRWASGFYDRLLLQAFAPTVTGRARAGAFRYGHPLARRILAPLRGGSA
jgi:CelD/BcsL family acetyltransferase involved in cellulose biosynthesis